MEQAIMSINKHILPNRFFQDLTGQKFGRIKVLSFSRRINNTTRWNCLCDCGNIKEIIGYRLKNKSTQSCGCLQKEGLAKRKTTHGRSYTKEYQTWCTIIKRCTNPKAINYKKYGGAGIKVCNRWLESFENFYTDMGDKPTPKHTIDRKDNALGYSKENCKWSTMKEQERNRTNNRLITYNNETLTIAEWSEKLGIKYQTIYARLSKKWPIEKALEKKCN